MLPRMNLVAICLAICVAGVTSILEEHQLLQICARKVALSLTRLCAEGEINTLEGQINSKQEPVVPRRNRQRVIEVHNEDDASPSGYGESLRELLRTCCKKICKISDFFSHCKILMTATTPDQYIQVVPTPADPVPSSLHSNELPTYPRESDVVRTKKAHREQFTYLSPYIRNIRLRNMNKVPSVVW